MLKIETKQTLDLFVDSGCVCMYNIICEEDDLLARSTDNDC